MVKEYVSTLSKTSVSVLMILKSTAATVKKLIHFFVMIYIVLIMILNFIQFEIYYYNPAIWTIFYKVIYNICGFLFTSSFILLLTYWIGMITDIFQIRKGAIFTKYTGPVFMVVQFTNFVIKLLTIISNARLFYLQTRLDLEKASIYYDFFVNTFVLIILVVFIVVNLYIFNKKVRRRIKIFTVIAAVVGSTFFVLTLIRVLIYYDNDKYAFATLILVSALCLEVIFVIYPIRIDVIKNQHINRFLGLFYIGYSKETKQETQSSHKKTSTTHLQNSNPNVNNTTTTNGATNTTTTATNTSSPNYHHNHHQKNHDIEANMISMDDLSQNTDKQQQQSSPSQNSNSTPNTSIDSIDNNNTNTTTNNNTHQEISSKPPNDINV